MEVRVELGELRQHWERHFEHVRQGDELVITQSGLEVARLVPPIPEDTSTPLSTEIAPDDRPRR